MLRLFSILYAMIGTSVAGIAMVIALTAGYDTLYYIVASVIAGAVLAVPVTWVIAKKLIKL